MKQAKHSNPSLLFFKIFSSNEDYLFIKLLRIFLYVLLFSVIGLVLTVFIFLFVPLITHRSTDKLTAQNMNLDRLKSIEKISIPIETASEATSYAANLDWVNQEEKDMANKFKMNDLKWNVNTHKITENNQSLWRVSLQYSASIPKPVCEITFTPDGHLLEGRENNFCGFNSNK